MSDIVVQTIVLPYYLMPNPMRNREFSCRSQSWRIIWTTVIFLLVIQPNRKGRQTKNVEAFVYLEKKTF